MDFLLLTLGLSCMLIGIMGCFLPLLPGPGLSWLGILILYSTAAIPANYWILSITLIITALLTVLDYIIPSKGTKHFGGSKYGIWGTNIGLVIGIFIPVPFGFLIGPFLGALIGELLFDSTNHNRALKAAAGSFIGFLASTFIQFLICILFLGLFISIVWQHRAGLF